MLIPQGISSKVLTVGPDYKNHRGGIGAVLNTYSRSFEIFNFIPTYQYFSNTFSIILYFFKQFIIVNKRLITDRNIELIHIHGASRGSFYRKFLIFLLVKYFYRKKTIYHIHGAEFHIFYKESNIVTKKAIRFFINNCDAMICLSDFWKDFFANNFCPKRISVLPNVIDYPQGTKKVNGAILTFLFLGYIGKRKGIFDLLDVVEKNKEDYRNRFRLVIGGNGDTGHLLKIIEAKGLEDMVHYQGWLDNDKKIKALNECDLYILPSYNEGLPVSVIEALSYGMPIISTPVGGIPELVIANQNGFLVQPGCLEQIEEAINFFLYNTEKVQEYGEVSKLVAQKYLPDAVMVQLSDIYISLLK